jgi:cell division transport system ATP-binding protein
MIIADRLEKSYVSNKVLSGLSFIVEPGEFVSITGPSGSGKTTLISSIIGAVKPDSGSLWVDSFDVMNLRENELHKLRGKIGVVFQDFKLLEKMTVFENVAFALQILGLNKYEIEEKTIDVLRLVGLEKQRNQFPGELSGGEKQRVSVARALIKSPSILIADEATGNLDPHNAMELLKLFLKINETGTTVLFSTHDREIVNFAAKRVLRLENGSLKFDLRNAGYDG